MVKSFGNYRRLARGWLGCSSLWAGDGHLLYVKGSGFLMSFSEEYLRFDLARIQAVTITPTYTSIVWIILGSCSIGFCSVFGYLALSAGWESISASAYFYYFLSAVLFLIALIGAVIVGFNFWLGRSCHTLIQTRTKTMRLRPLRRLKSAQKFIDQLAPLVNAAQAGNATEPAIGSINVEVATPS